MAFELPDLPYGYDALGPYMSAETLEFHHDKHHNAYVTNGNNLLKDSGLEGKSLEDVVKESFGKNAGLSNNAGQHYNHTHFWNWMAPNGGGGESKIPGKL
ncbi:MAG: superoxide dismutase, partial [Rhizobiaceae bacterium]|nr:superoxide dismutase [Rhizobiaceae bacterium]